MGRQAILKAGTYFWVHMGVALGVAFAVTGNWAAAVAIGLLEPLVQVFAYALHEWVWARRCAQRRGVTGWARHRLDGLRAASYFCVHVVVAMVVVYAVTGDLLAAMAVGLIEPAVQVVAYHLHERAWRRASTRRRTCSAVHARSAAVRAGASPRA
jgi:uncharacterized membrane protein